MINGNIRTIYEDAEETQAAFPITKVEAITNNDNIALENLLLYHSGDTPVPLDYSVMDLLWENENSESGFSNQTVELPDNGYNLFLIRIKMHNSFSSLNLYSYICFKTKTTIMDVACYPSNENRASRACRVVNNKDIQFDVGHYGVITTNNNGCVPVEIYGLKLPLKDLTGGTE